jgi:putative addiction module killer protein
MNAPQIRLLEYVTEDGENVYRTWIRKLEDNRARARIRVRLNRIRLGNFGDCKPVGEGVGEIRIDYGPGYRVYFAKRDFTVVILLCGGTKKKQSEDIKLAQKYWKDYKRRMQ